MRFGKIFLVLLLVFLAFEAGVIYQKRKHSAKGDNSGNPGHESAGGITVRVAQPVVRDMYETVRTTGTLEPVEKADIFAKLPGEVIAVHVEEGDRVETDQLLAELDDKELKLAVKQAKAALRQANVNYRNTSRTWKRNKELFEEELISVQQYEQVRAQNRVAASQVQSARVALEETRLNLSYTKIRSPMAGIITRRACDKHQKISSAERLFEVARLETLRVRVRITEKEIAAIKGTQRPVRLRIEALKDTPLDREFAGNLSFISPVVDADSGTVEVRVEVPNVDSTLTPGMFARLVIETKLHPGAPAILKQALLGEEGAFYVFVVGPDDKGRPVAHRVDVKTALADETFVELTGDEPGRTDWVVTEGQNLLNEGDAVIFASPEEGEPAPTGFSLASGETAGSGPP